MTEENNFLLLIVLSMILGLIMVLSGYGIVPAVLLLFAVFACDMLEGGGE